MPAPADEAPRAAGRGIKKQKEAIIRNELFREVAAIRLDTVWRMLALDQDGRLPAKDEEGATGTFDNKGAMFVPGGLVFEDSDRNPVHFAKHGELGARAFREKIRAAMRWDNATLLYPDGLAAGVNLNNGFFAQVSADILAYKRAATRRRAALEAKPDERVSSDAITRSHCPLYLSAPYGSRTKLSSCLSVCLSEPRLYYVICRSTFALRREQETLAAWDHIGSTRRAILGKKKIVLAAPHIVVCHTTRYKETSLCGVTRILGIGKFGEFASFTLERSTGELLSELGLRDKGLPPEAVFAEHHGVQVVGALRIYSATKPGKRLRRFTTHLVLPAEELQLDLESLAEQARERYRIPVSASQ